MKMKNCSVSKVDAYFYRGCNELIDDCIQTRLLPISFSNYLRTMYIFINYLYCILYMLSTLIYAINNAFHVSAMISFQIIYICCLLAYAEVILCLLLINNNNM